MTEPGEIRRIVELCVPPRRLADRIGASIESGSWPDDAAVREIVHAAVCELTLGELIDALVTFYDFSNDDAPPPSELIFDREAGIAASSAEDRAAMLAMSEAYELHFGFPPVVFVNGHEAIELANILEQAIASSPAAEFARIRGAVSDIYADRLVRLLSDPLLPDHTERPR